MPKWGDPTRLWGALDFTYGVDGTNPGGELQWIFLVDWDNDNSFSYNEASYLIDLETTRGERYFVKPGGNGFEVMRPGEGTATLTDKAGRFDPDNASGPLYEKILPGRKFRLLVKDLATEVIYPVMAGFIYDIPPITELDKIQLSLRESMSLLDRKVSIPILYRNSISDAIRALVDNAKWPATFGASIDDEPQQVTTFAVDNINALDTILDLGAAALGQVFSDNTGKLKFYSRGHSTMPSVAVDQAMALKQIRRSQPWENQRNIVQIIANKKVKAREAAIWQSGQPFKIDGNGSTTITVNYAPAIDVRVYKLVANTLVTGKGTNKTSSVSYTLEAYSKSLTITLTNAYSGAVYVALVITGRPIIDQAIMASVTNALTTETVFELDNPWMQDLSHAQSYATMIANFLDETQRTIELQIEQRPALQFSFDLMDAIPLTIAKLGIDTTYYAGLIEHRWQAENGQSVVTTIVLRPRLTDATAVSNDDEDPDLPYIPEPTLPPGGLPINTPTTPPVTVPVDPDDPGGCLANIDAPANGPFDMLLYPTELVSNGTYFVDLVIGGGVWARPAGFTNPTKIAITGDWLHYNKSTAQWEGTTDNNFWRVSMNGTYLTQGTYTDGGIGTRVLTVDLGGAQPIYNLRLELDPASPSAFTTGSVVNSGTVQANDGVGIATILTPGQYYSIESADGPWDAGPTVPNPLWQVGITGGTTLVAVGYNENTNDWTDTGALAYEILTPEKYSRGYFLADTIIHAVKVIDSVYTDNTGSIGFVVRNAYYDEIYKWVVRGVALYNVCSA